MTRPQRFEVTVYAERRLTPLGVHAALLRLTNVYRDRIEVCEVVEPDRVKPCVVAGPAVEEPTEDKIDRFMAAVEEMRRG